MKKRALALVIFLFIIQTVWLAAGEIEIKFSSDSLLISDKGLLYSYGNLPSINVNSQFSLPVKTVELKTIAKITESDLSFYLKNQKIIASVSPDDILFNNLPTSVDRACNAPPQMNSDKLKSVLFNVESFEIDGIYYTSLSIFPITVDDDYNIVLNSKIVIESPFIERQLNQSDILKNRQSTFIDKSYPITGKTNNDEGPPLEIDYAIITTSELAGTFQQLANYKNATGISTAVVIIDSILEYYSGIDPAEQVREYLKDFYQSGGIYVLFGGDNIILPVRYTYYYNTSSTPSNPYYLMPSDLYFADLDGDWDYDGDGIWGEPSDDAPDLSPELIVGRLPLRTTEAAKNYINKLIKYETNPGDGDFEYLNKSLFFSSDEMRDFPVGGQHKVIADELPAHCEIDTVFGVEFPTGYDPNPTNACGADGINKISEGFGFINIIAHGRIDGFTVKSSEYGNWPASLIITEEGNGWHGSISDIAENDRSSLYYSLSCNVGGYDLDSIDGEPTDWSLAERLISKSAGGAMGMIANSRWGWVYSSYNLQASFTRHLYNQANGNPAIAMYNSWIDYPFYRDLIYGQNYFGDPTLTIYTDIPTKLEVQLSSSPNNYQLNLSTENGSVADAYITLMHNDEIIETGYSDENGSYLFEYKPEGSEEYFVTAVYEDYTIARTSFVPSLTLSSENEDNLTPDVFRLSQNHPNPFNPVTSIDYSLPIDADVSFEIYNLLGQMVKNINTPSQSAGYHTVMWDGTNNINQPVSTGIYFYRISAGEFTQTRKMVLIK